jgi:hypothetical protein
MFAMSLLMDDADARRRRRRKRAKKPVATQQTRVGIERLMGKFKWGQSSAKVTSELEKALRAREEPLLKKIKDPLEQDRKRRELMDEIRKVKKSIVKFTGKRTPWDVSLVDKEYAHKNNESMIVSWDKRERRFFFFHHDKLWKMFIAFNADMFQGKTFEDFAKAMEGRFGGAERKYSVTLKGEPVMDHLLWPASRGTVLLAYDYTGFYGNFCLSLFNKAEWGNVKSARQLNNPNKKVVDPLVDSVTKDPGSAEDANEDIVDQITGKGTRPPSVGSSGGGGSSAPYTPKKRKKKLDPKNPLGGLDI